MDCFDIPPRERSDRAKIQPAQPRRSELRCVQNARLIAGHFSFASLLLLFRKRSRSAYLLGCKRPRDGSLSLPTFCGLTAAIIESERAFCLALVFQSWIRTAPFIVRFGYSSQNPSKEQRQILDGKGPCRYNKTDVTSKEAPL